ncbi:soluble lamin-associated protein of 75 kDa isoform X2 [Corvus cornix cornix]|uniref:soluble lamin-associated protein of 75 kDa isoform X2 n=1 Tax=Corvus cornix cornix TaxID=932674 RepID=UPI0008165084|nr:soluble lamin-associated protein of 75 kDa isoform X2 [Corvus cornix cornix]XP_017596161.1 PREDICTED: soluble lamin-associated protein of 75 kDa isoform X2 [Corvus brachyrhynchos]
MHIKSMSFPVDILNNYSHEDLENSAEDYLFDLRWGNPNSPEFFSLPDRRKVPISLTSVGFVPLYGEEQTHKVLALFAPWDSLTAIALYLADQWWSIDDIVRTSVPARQGLHQVKSVGERVVLYVLNRIIYRTQEMERNEIPFLCHGSSHYAKIMWKKGEAIGFYSVKPTGSVCSSLLRQKYKLPVLDTMFVRKKHRGKDSGLIMLEDFVDSFTEEPLGLRYPLSPFMYTACKQYLEKYPEDKNLLWQVEGGGDWFQRKSIMSIVQKEDLKIAGEALKKENKSLQAEDNFCQSAVSEASGPRTEVETQLSTDSQKGKESTDVHASTSEDPNTAHVSIWTRSSHLKRQRLNKNRQEPGPETSQRDEESALQVSKSRPELLASESSEDLVEVPKVDAVEKDEEIIVENEGQSVLEVEMHVSPSEKQSETEEMPSEPLNGEVAEETGKTSLMAEGETINEVPSGESKLLSESQGKEPVTLFVPLILEAPAKPPEGTESEKVLNENDSEMLTEEVTSVEKEGTEEQQEPEKTSTEDAAASASKEEPSDNGLPNSVVTESAEESVSENLPSSLEDQNEEAGQNSQEAPAALSQSSLVMVELEGVSFQQPSGQEAQKNQLEEPSEESPEQTDHYMQTVAERAADSSSEEAEIEVPIVDRRNLRRKAKGYKGPPKKKGKPA